GRVPELRAPRRAEHAAPDDVPRWRHQPESRARGRARKAGRVVTTGAHPTDEPPARPALIGPGYTFGTVTDKISSIVLGRRTPIAWFVGFRIRLSLLPQLLLP